MSSQLLVCFNRINKDSSVDLGEKIGDFGLGLLRIGFGKTVTVQESIKSPVQTPLKSPVQTPFTQTVYSTITRIAAIALFILAFPLTILLAGIGSVGTAFSKSHKKVFNLFITINASKQVESIASGGGSGDSANPEAPAQNLLPLLTGESAEGGECATSQKRKIPPVSFHDTVRPVSLVSVHGTGELFLDCEIVEKLDIVRVEVIKDSLIYAYYTRNGKAIIQQQGTRACTAATAAMLIMDNGGTPDVSQLKSRNLGLDVDILRDLETARLGFIRQTVDTNDLEWLRNLIRRGGSCIVSLTGSLGQHSIVVDEVSDDLATVRLRDPYHGWEITVTREAFLKEWKGGKAIQVINDKRR
jgi:hypothetical protein